MKAQLHDVIRVRATLWPDASQIYDAEVIGVNPEGRRDGQGPGTTK